MSRKCTPGPWYIRTNRHTSTDGRPWGWLDAAPPGGPQRNIPGVQVTWTRGEASEANARLIAAAPDYHDAAFWIHQAVAANAAPVNPLAALEDLALDGEHVTLDAGLVLDLLKAHAKATGAQQ